MDFWEALASVLWIGFFASIVAGYAGLALAGRGRRTLGLSLLLTSTLVLLGFSFAAGFSIGRFTVALAVLLIGVILGMGRGRPVMLASVVAALGLYIVFSWLDEPLVVGGELPGWLFGAWAVPLYALLALGAFALALSKSSVPKTPSARS